MGKDSSSTQRRKQDKCGNSSRKKPSVTKAGSSPVSASVKTGSAISTRSTRGTTSKEPETESNSTDKSTRKSMRLEKKDRTPPVKRKLEVLEVDKASHSPLRRSDRGKTRSSLASSDSNSNGEVNASPNAKRKKIRREKSVKELTCEAMKTSKTAQGVQNSNGRTKKTLTRNTYKTLFKQQRRRDIVTDLDKELKRPEKLPVEDAHDGVQDCIKKIEDRRAERDCEGGENQSPSKSNHADGFAAFASSDHEAPESSHLRLNCSSGEACGNPLQENVADSLNCIVGENVILLPWYTSNVDRELERPRKLCQDERNSLEGNTSSPVEDEVQDCIGEIEEECNANGNTRGEEAILLPCYASDSNKELVRPNELSHDDSSEESMSNPVEDEEDRVEDCSEDIEEECGKKDCGGGTDQYMSISNDADSHVLRNHGELEISCLNSKCNSKEAFDLSKMNSRGAFVGPSQEMSGRKLGEEGMDNSGLLQVDHSLVVELPSPEMEILPDSRVEGGTGVLSRSSSKCVKDYFVGTCSSCCKWRRLEYDSPTQELCSCSIGLSSDLWGKFRSEDTTEQARCDLNDGNLTICDICKLDGELLCCDGKDCNKSYHRSCLDIPLDEYLVGLWYCFSCVKKKIKDGFHSVAVGMEAIWDVREIVNEGLQRQKQYLVKYKGLSHIHNHWMSENQLLLEAPKLISEFDEQKQDSKWRQEWTVPHRLLKRRPLWSTKHCDNSQSDTSNCQYEWLVKWCGMDYEHATWELENASIFHSPQAKSLIKEFENRHQRAKEVVSSSSSSGKSMKQSVIKLPMLRAGCSSADEQNQLNAVNKLIEFWDKGQNAIVIDDQDRIANVILFIASLLPDVTRPFLIISTSSALSIWESEFSRLAPFINVVVYSGSQDSREIIRSTEYFADKGRIMLQVLLSSVEALMEDTEVLLPRWEAIIVDEIQDSGVSKHFEQITNLRTAIRILLFNGQFKESSAEYLKILPLLDSSEACHGLDCCQLREKLSLFIAYNCRIDSSKFVEYWVPVSVSNVQLEQYCSTLLLSYSTLRSPSFKDIVGGALHDVLISTKKSCDHPYFVDLGLQWHLTKALPAVEYLDVGIKASGKLQFLDILLSEIQRQGKRVLILYQFSTGMLTGDTLDDFLRQRFGSDSYERVDKGMLPSRKQAALNKFNDKGSGEFVFLLEKRACSSTIKLTSVDAVVIFDSDWCLINDNRAVQKLSFDSSPVPTKIFRLYTCCTMEEKVLDLATNNLTLDSTLQNVSKTTSHLLLMWGASYLFSKLDEFHGSNASNNGANLSPDVPVLQDVAGELLNLLTPYAENSCKNSLITKVQRTGSTYSKSAPLFGHSKVKSSDGKVSHLFWDELLGGRRPTWRFLSGSSHRNRKRVQYLDALPEYPGSGPDGVTKKPKKITNCSANAASPKPRPREGGSGVISPKSFASVAVPSDITFPAFEVLEAGFENRIELHDVQKNLHSLLKSKILKLSEILHLPEDVKTMGQRFLEYIVDNHQIHSEPSTILQAFQISLVWIASSLVQYKLDKKNSLNMVKQLLDFHCTEEEVTNVHSKLRILQKKFKTSAKFKEIELTKDFSADQLEHVLRKCKKRKRKLLLIQEEEIDEFNKLWEERRTEIMNQHRIESAVVRTIHQHNQAIKLENLKRVEEVFARKLDEHEHEKEVRLQDLREKQLNERIEEDKKADSWLKKITDSGQKERSISLSESVGPNEQKNSDQETASISRENHIPNVTEMAELATSDPIVPMSTYSEEVGCGATTEIPTVPSILLRSKNTEEEYNKGSISESVPAENNNMSGSSRVDKKLSSEAPSVVSCAEEILKTRAHDVLSQKNDESLRSSTSGTIRDGDATGCVNTTNILDEAEIELSYQTNGTAAQADLCAASTHVNQSYDVIDLTEDGPSSAPPNSELIKHHLPRDQPPPQQGEQSMLQSRENPVRRLPTQIVNEVRLHDATHEPSHYPQQIDLQGQPRPSFSDPLQIELDRLQKEREEATKLHENEKLLLKSKYDEEVKAVLAELHKNYEAKLKGAEAEFLTKKEQLDAHHNKVFMNRILAQAFRMKSQEYKPSVSSGMREVPSTNFLHELLLLSSQKNRGTSSVSGAPNRVPPVTNKQTAAPPVPAPPHSSPVSAPPRPSPVSAPPRPSPVPAPPRLSPVPAPSRPSPVPAPPRPSPTISNMQMRQPSTLPNTSRPRNFPVGEMRAPAPHLRLSNSASGPVNISGSQGLTGHDPQRRPHFSSGAQIPSRQPSRMRTQQPQMQSEIHNFSPAVGPRNVENISGVPRPPNVLQRAPEPRTNFVGLHLSQGGMLGRDKVNGGVNNLAGDKS